MVSRENVRVNTTVEQHEKRAIELHSVMCAVKIPEGEEFFHGLADLAVLQLFLQVLQTFFQHRLIQTTGTGTNTHEYMRKALDGSI